MHRKTGSVNLFSLAKQMSNKEALTISAALVGGAIGCMGLLTLGAFWLVLPAGSFDWWRMMLMLPLHTLWLLGAITFVGWVLLCLLDVKVPKASEPSIAEGIMMLASISAMMLSFGISASVEGLEWTMDAYFTVSLLAVAIVFIVATIITMYASVAVTAHPPSHQ